ncbi:MAG: cobalamin-independent methionine synthase II family protein [Nitrososphaerota archaeon]|jgi:5-methyltetrahydropteroyltriglutamate--homocysteine methyltransferase|nr:cobalamin-independent methionine synthase II family protein [Nitrososphaerota archaeon]
MTGDGLFPTSVVGSLPRPEWLTDGIAANERGELSDERLREYYDEAVILALKQQETAGVDEVSDGEQRRFSFLGFVAEKIPSFRLVPAARLMSKEAAGYADDMNLHVGIISNPVIVGPIRRTAPLVADEVRYAKEHTDKPVMAPIIGPFTLLINSWNKKMSGRYYPSPEDAFGDLTRLLREELLALKEAGASFVQLDEPAIGNFVDFRYTKWLLALNGWKVGDVQELHRISAELVNRTVKGVGGIKLGVHICRGNWRSDEAHYSHGGYENMIDEILDLKVRRLVLEYATKRAGSYDVFRDHPWPGEVGLGVIDVKDPRVEAPKEIVRRVEGAAEVFGEERLVLNPDCGFSSGRPWPVVSRQTAFAKLKAQTKAALLLRAGRS